VRSFIFSVALVLVGCTQSHLRIESVSDVAPVKGRDVVNARLTFNERTRNENGCLRVRLDDRCVSVRVSAVGASQETRELDAQWAPKRGRLKPEDLVGRECEFVKDEP
jgi:hypothetical protein